MRTRVRLRQMQSEAFVGPVLTLVGGSAAAHLATFGVRPILTRLYEPEAFGVLTLFLAVAALVDTISSGRYEDAVLLPKDDRRAADVLRLALWMVAGSAVLTALGVAGAVAYGVPNGAAWALLPVGVLATGILAVSARWHARRERFGLVSTARAAHGWTAAGVQLAAGVVAGGALGLVAGSVAGMSVAALVVGIGLVRKDRALLRSAPERMGLVARRYIDFPRFAAPANLLKGFAGRVAVLALAPFGAATVGFFGVAYATIALPLDVLAASVSEVFFVRASETKRGADLAALTARTLRRLAVLTALPAALVVAAGPDLFAFVFGEAWREAGVYARWLAPWIFLTILSSPLTSLFDVLERQRLDLAVASVLFVGQLAGVLVGGWLGGALGAVIGVSVVGVVMRLGHLAVMLRLAGSPLVGPFSEVGFAAARAAVFAVPLAVAVSRYASAEVLIGLSLVLAMIYYAVIGLRKSG